MGVYNIRVVLVLFDNIRDQIYSMHHKISSQWRHNKRDGISIPASRVSAKPFVQAQIKETPKVCATGLCVVWGESTGDRWIPLTKDQWRGVVGQG